MMGFYEAKPGYWLMEGVSWEAHQAAVAANYTGESDFGDEFAQIDAWAAPLEAWITKDGERIEFADLEDGHLVNIVRMACRNGQLQRAQSLESDRYEPLIEEAKRRGGEVWQEVRKALDDCED